jgi:hypothetical protein
VQMFVKSCWHLMLFAALAAAAGPVCAQGTEAGRFLSVVGDVRVGREGAAQRAAQRAAQFYEGESIVTAAGSLAQLRMTDGALMSVRGDTEIKMERFSYAGENDRNASFLMSVLKGGLRTITGVIGRQNRDRYRITTATVTLGVRGTDFEIVHVPQPMGSREVPAGTYNRVYEGMTSIQNRAGVALLVSRDQTAFAALQGTVAPILVPPPAALFGRPTPLPVTLRQDGADKAPTAGRPAPGATPIDTPRTVSPTSTPIEAPRTLSPAVATPIQTAPIIQQAPTASPGLAPAAPPVLAPAAPVLAPVAPVLAPVAPVLAPVPPVLAPAPPKPIAPLVPIIGR